MTAATSPSDVKVDIHSGPIFHTDEPTHALGSKSEEPAPCCRTKGFLGYELCGRCFCGWEDHCALVFEGVGTAATIVAFVAKNYLLGSLTGGGTLALIGMHWCMRRYRSTANLKKIDKELDHTDLEMQQTLAKTKAEAAEFQKKAEAAEAKEKEIAEERAKFSEERTAFQNQVEAARVENQTLKTSLQTEKETNEKLALNIKSLTALLAQYKGFLGKFNEQNGTFLTLIKQADQKNAALSLIDQKLDKQVAAIGDDFKQEEDHLDREIKTARALQLQTVQLLSEQIESLETKTMELAAAVSKLENADIQFKQAAATLKEQTEQEKQSLAAYKETLMAEVRSREEAIAAKEKSVLALRDEVHQDLEQFKKQHETNSASSTSAGSTVNTKLDEILKTRDGVQSKIQSLISRATKL